MLSTRDLLSVRTFILLLLIPALLGGYSGDSSGLSDDRTAPLLEGMGDHHHPITTDDSLAQRYFD